VEGGYWPRAGGTIRLDRQFEYTGSACAPGPHTPFAGFALSGRRRSLAATGSSSPARRAVPARQGRLRTLGVHARVRVHTHTVRTRTHTLRFEDMPLSPHKHSQPLPAPHPPPNPTTTANLITNSVGGLLMFQTKTAVLLVHHLGKKWETCVLL
jgi:hypothetical protein